MLGLEVVAAVGIAVWALVNVWALAYPPEPGTVCALIYPAPPGCAPHARFTPAFISAIVITLSCSAAIALLLTVGRRHALVAVWVLGGLALLGALADNFVVWGGIVARWS